MEMYCGASFPRSAACPLTPFLGPPGKTNGNRTGAARSKKATVQGQMLDILDISF